MPRRNDLHTILVIGSGPIVIGQACEFDYSGTQACRVLAEEGYRVVLANSNPATIMTDPATADRTYVEPLDPEVLARDHREGAAGRAAAHAGRADRAEPHHGAGRARRARALRGRGHRRPPRGHRHGRGPRPLQVGHGGDRSRGAALGLRPLAREAEEIAEEIGYPIMVRPSFILGGKGTGIAEDAAHFAQLAAEGLAASPVGQILVEQSIAGWKEFELEVMRDAADNCVVVCSIENFDPMGVHTGDSITVAPAQTLTDVEYQAMRDDAFACLRRVGVETGGSNVQFAVDPATGRRVIIEMNPRVSRSSALASKATGFPDRQDRRPPRRGLPARRDPQRHHQGDAGLVRADHRLRGDQGPALGLREAARRRGAPRHPHAVRRRGHGDRPHVLRVAAEGAALARAGPGRSQRRPGGGGARRVDRRRALGRIGVATPDRIFELEAALRRGVQRRRGRGPHRHRPVVRPPAGGSPRARRAARRRGAARSGRPTSGGPSGWGSPTPSWPTCAQRPRRPGPGGAAGARRPAHVQDGRHLRRRVRGVHALPLLHLRGRGRGPPSERRPGRHPGLGSEPHRPGHRVRLLLRPRLHVAARRRLRDGHGQLQPRDGVDRLRHVRPPLLRAAHREDVANVLDAERRRGSSPA